MKISVIGQTIEPHHAGLCLTAIFGWPGTGNYHAPSSDSSGIFPEEGNNIVSSCKISRTSVARKAWDHENWFESKIVPASQGKFLYL